MQAEDRGVFERAGGRADHVHAEMPVERHGARGDRVELISPNAATDADFTFRARITVTGTSSSNVTTRHSTPGGAPSTPISRRTSLASRTCPSIGPMIPPVVVT